MRHIFREHYQEADHWADWSAEGQRQIISDQGNDTEQWKAVRGFWDGSSKVNGRRGVDKNKWIKIRNIAVPLGNGTFMIAEVVGVCVSTGILDLVLNKSLSMLTLDMLRPLVDFLYTTSRLLADILFFCHLVRAVIS